MRQLLLLLFTISSFAQSEKKIDTLILGKTIFHVQKVIQNTSEMQYYHQVDDSGNIINEYQVEIYHDPVPYSSFFFKPAHTKGVFFQVTSLKDSNMKKRNMKKDSIYVYKTIKKLLLNETMADDLAFEQAMKINGTTPNDCSVQVKTYAENRYRLYGQIRGEPSRSRSGRYTVRFEKPHPSSTLSSNNKIYNSFHIWVDENCRVVKAKSSKRF